MRHPDDRTMTRAEFREAHRRARINDVDLTGGPKGWQNCSPKTTARFAVESSYWRTWRQHAANGGTGWASRNQYIRGIREAIALFAQVRHTYRVWRNDRLPA